MGAAASQDGSSQHGSSLWVDGADSGWRPEGDEDRLDRAADARVRCICGFVAVSPEALQVHFAQAGVLRHFHDVRATRAMNTCAPASDSLPIEDRGEPDDIAACGLAYNILRPPAEDWPLTCVCGFTAVAPQALQSHFAQAGILSHTYDHRAAVVTANKSKSKADEAEAKAVLMGIKSELRASYTRVIDLFRSLDHDNSGFVDAREMRSVLESSHDIGSEAKADALFRLLDRDGDRSVGFDELHAALRLV